MLMMLAVVGCIMERVAADAQDACWFGLLLERAALDAHDARCFGAQPASLVFW